MTVGDELEEEKITKEMVFDSMDLSNYWASTANFIVTKWNTNVDDLTEKQENWFKKAKDDLIEMRIEGKL